MGLISGHFIRDFRMFRFKLPRLWFKLCLTVLRVMNLCMHSCMYMYVCNVDRLTLENSIYRTVKLVRTWSFFYVVYW